MTALGMGLPLPEENQEMMADNLPAAEQGMPPEPQMALDPEKPTPPDMSVEEVEEAGRGGDTLIGHLTMGEIVVPKDLAEDPQVRSMLESVFREARIDIAQYTVGDKANSINPETNQPEFGFFKKAFGGVMDFVDDALGIETRLSPDEMEAEVKRRAERERSQYNSRVAKQISDWEARLEGEQEKFRAEADLAKANSRTEAIQAERKFKRELFSRRKEIETFGIDRSTTDSQKSAPKAQPFNKRKWARTKKQLSVASKKNSMRRPQ